MTRYTSAFRNTDPKINLICTCETKDSNMATAGIVSSYYEIHDTLTPTNFIKLTSDNIPNNFEKTLSEYYKIPKDFIINGIEDKIKQNKITLYAVTLNQENDKDSSIYYSNYFEGNAAETFSFNSTLNKCSVSIDDIKNNTIKFEAYINPPSIQSIKPEYIRTNRTSNIRYNI